MSGRTHCGVVAPVREKFGWRLVRSRGCLTRDAAEQAPQFPLVLGKLHFQRSGVNRLGSRPKPGAGSAGWAYSLPCGSKAGEVLEHVSSNCRLPPLALPAG